MTSAKYVQRKTKFTIKCVFIQAVRKMISFDDLRNIAEDNDIPTVYKIYFMII